MKKEILRWCMNKFIAIIGIMCWWFMMPAGSFILWIEYDETFKESWVSYWDAIRRSWYGNDR